MPTAHRLSFPTCLSHPRSIHLLCHLDSPSAANLPCLGLQQQTGPEISELCGSYRVPSLTPILAEEMTPLDLFFSKKRMTIVIREMHQKYGTKLKRKGILYDGHGLDYT
jgi:hypothetical protein